MTQVYIVKMKVKMFAQCTGIGNLNDVFQFNVLMEQIKSEYPDDENINICNGENIISHQIQMSKWKILILVAVEWL